MASLGFVIDVNTVPEPKDFENLPDGDYNFQVTDSDAVANDGDSYVKLTYTVLDGTLAGRTHTERFYIWHPNEQRRAIALEGLAALGRAIGVYQINDTQLLHMKPFLAKVKTGKPNAEGKTYTNASKYRPYTGPVGGGTAPQSPFGTAQSAPAGFQGFPGAHAAPAPAQFQQAPAPAPMAAPGGMPNGFPMPGQNTAGAFQPQSAPFQGGYPGAAPMATPAPVPAAPGGFPGFPGR
jgi:hypothetical protein